MARDRTPLPGSVGTGATRTAPEQETAAGPQGSGQLLALVRSLLLRSDGLRVGDNGMQPSNFRVDMSQQSLLALQV
jgi:hypothetical protein